MGTIVTLPPRRPVRAPARQTADATILLFMGVRYVRDIDTDEMPETAAGDPGPDLDTQLPPLEIA